VSMEHGRKALQMRWDVFQSFDEPLQQVLQNQSLEEVDKVLGAMNVEHAEDEGQVCAVDVAEILNFLEGGL
ncbi:hypothetical protein L227DRAFT_464043, partial [Lentinus tigrinus ALCF2SS1-6]